MPLNTVCARIDASRCRYFPVIRFGNRVVADAAGVIHLLSTLRWRERKRGTGKVPVPPGNAGYILLEVTLQHALQGDAVASFVLKLLKKSLIFNDFFNLQQKVPLDAPLFICYAETKKGCEIMAKYTGVTQNTDGSWTYRLKVKLPNGKIIDTRIKKDERGNPFLTARSAYEARKEHEANPVSRYGQYTVAGLPCLVPHRDRAGR